MLIINLGQDQKKIRLSKTFDSVSALYEGRELTIKAFRNAIFSIKET